MTEQWKELKETIIEMRDNDGTGTQQEVCKFLANLMDVLEKQMQESKTEHCKVTAETVQDILDYLEENNAIWDHITWVDKNGKGFETDQGYFVQGLEGFRAYLKESEEKKWEH